MSEPNKKPPSPTSSGDNVHSNPFSGGVGGGDDVFNMNTNTSYRAAFDVCSRPGQRKVDDTATTTTPSRIIDERKDNNSKGVFNAILNKANRANPLLKLTKKTDRVDHQYDIENVPEKLIKKDDNNASSLYKDLALDEAEEAVLANVEERGRRTVAAEDGFRPAVEGERPPLKVPSLGHAFMLHMASSGPEDPKRSSSPSLKSMVQKVMAIQRFKGESSTKNFHGERKGQHRRARTLLTDMDEAKANDFAFHQGGHFSDMERAFNDDISGRHDASDAYEGRETSFAVEACVEATEDKRIPHEGQPLLSGSDDDASMSSKSERVQQAHWKARRRAVMQSQLRAFLNPLNIWRSFSRWFVRSMLLVALPLFIAALVLFYTFGNPKPPAFFPGSATLSWWCNFVGRQLLIFELARFCQFIMIDCLLLSNKFVSQSLGSWVTIFCIQSKGWPFIVGSWGLWSLILLHGGSGFQLHWLHFTKIAIYSTANSGSYILGSETYLRILLFMVLAGVLGTLKRTTVTIIFGRRMFDAYKKRLEDILNEIILISEIAELSVESETIANVMGLKREDFDVEPPREIKTAREARASRMPKVRWSSLKFDGDVGSWGMVDDEDNDDDDDVDGEPDDAEDGRIAKEGRTYESSSRLPIKDLLDKWEEPLSKRDQSRNTTVNDILKFRRALTYMDLDYPFSEAFGLASTRDEMIVSAEAVYYRLMILCPNSSTLCFSTVFQMLFLEEDGTEDKTKKRALRNLFRPDTDDKLSLVSFVQSCDAVYKKIRYFRASVGNASVIDHVLESIIDVFFFLCLSLVGLSILNFNPWPLLVSLSTLMVAGSFAIGPTCAKAIEGVILVVGRRPYDIGDRIVIADKASDQVPSMGMSWIVEDITLFSTTLRFGATNEVASFSNGSITNARITNCARSKNATISLLMKFHISCHEGNTMDVYRRGIEEYIQEYPNIWDSIFFFRCEDIDPNNEVVSYRVAVRSRFSWQVSNKVIQFQGELHRFLVSLSSKLHIKYDTPNTRSIMYYGGSLVDGGVKDYKTRVLNNSNIINSNNGFTGLGTMGLGLGGHRTNNGMPGDSHDTRPVNNVERLERIEGTIGNVSVKQDLEKTRDDLDDNSSLNSISGLDPDKVFLRALKRSHG